MACTTLHDKFNIAAPQGARRHELRSSAGSALPQRRGWLPAWPRRLSFSGLRASSVGSRSPLMFFASSSPDAMHCAADEDALTYPLSHVRVLTRDEIAAGSAFREDVPGTSVRVAACGVDLSGHLSSGGGPSSWPRNAAAEASDARSRRTP